VNTPKSTKRTGRELILKSGSDESVSDSESEHHEDNIATGDDDNNNVSANYDKIWSR
jgi:hypothetical protein